MKDRLPHLTAVVGVLVWAAIYVWRGLVGHRAFETNAYDLSVFDYAIWNLAHGDRGFVPFYGYSLFSDHFMPALYAFLPLSSVSSSAAWLLMVPAVATAAGALLFRQVIRQEGISPWHATALMLVFL